MNTLEEMTNFKGQQFTTPRNTSFLPPVWILWMNLTTLKVIWMTLSTGVLPGSVCRHQWKQTWCFKFPFIVLLIVKKSVQSSLWGKRVTRFSWTLTFPNISTGPQTFFFTIEEDLKSFASAESPLIDFQYVLSHLNALGCGLGSLGSFRPFSMIQIHIFFLPLSPFTFASKEGLYLLPYIMPVWLTQQGDSVASATSAHFNGATLNQCRVVFFSHDQLVLHYLAQFHANPLT